MGWENIFTVGALFALLGGALGGLFATAKVQDGIILSTLTILVGAVAGVGVVEYLKLVDLPWLALSVGMITGVLAPRILSVIEAMAPSMIKDWLPALLDRLANTWLGRGK